MDDSRFDDIIKKKLNEYEEPGFDPAALAGLQQQMEAISLSPWYSRYASQLWIGSGFLVSTVIIVSVLWYKDDKLNEKIISLTGQAEEITKLQTEIKYLKSISHDTIKLTEIREQPTSALYASLLVQMEKLKAELEFYRTERSRVSNSIVENDPATTLNNPIGAYPDSIVHYSDGEINFSRIAPHYRSKNSARAEWSDLPMSKVSNHTLSTKAIRDIQKHYSKGIGIKIGPVAELSHSNYSAGKGSNALSVGVMADFILSPSLSFETGAKYTHRFYDITDKSETSLLEFPDLDESLGELQQVDIDNYILEFPFNLKYRFPITLKTQWVGALGYSPLLYLRQDFEYKQAWSGDPNLSVISTYRQNSLALYSGTLNFALGFSQELKNKRIFETSVYYQLGLGNKGLEKTNSNFVGLRGIYWLKAR